MSKFERKEFRVHDSRCVGIDGLPNHPWQAHSPLEIIREEIWVPKVWGPPPYGSKLMNLGRLGAIKLRKVLREINQQLEPKIVKPLPSNMQNRGNGALIREPLSD